MTEEHTDDRETKPQSVETDGGVATGAAETHRDTEYLESEVNLLKPSTPFMRDHLRVVWTGFAAWFLIVFGPVTLTYLAPEMMTSAMPVIGFPLHYFLVAIGAPGGAVLLSVWYARRRDRLDEKYGIDHSAPIDTDSQAATATTDGGADE